MEKSTGLKEYYCQLNVSLHLCSAKTNFNKNEECNRNIFMNLKITAVETIS